MTARVERGEQAPVPILAGFNEGEMRSLPFLIPPPPTSAAQYERAIRERYADLADEFLLAFARALPAHIGWSTRVPGPVNTNSRVSEYL